MHRATEIDELDVDPWVLHLKDRHTCLVLLVVSVRENPEFEILTFLLGTSEDEKCRDKKQNEHYHRSLAERKTLRINRKAKHKKLRSHRSTQLLVVSSQQLW